MNIQNTTFVSQLYTNTANQTSAQASTFQALPSSEATKATEEGTTTQESTLAQDTGDTVEISDQALQLLAQEQEANLGDSGVSRNSIPLESSTIPTTITEASLESTGELGTEAVAITEAETTSTIESTTGTTTEASIAPITTQTSSTSPTPANNDQPGDPEKATAGPIILEPPDDF